MKSSNDKNGNIEHNEKIKNDIWDSIFNDIKSKNGLSIKNVLKGDNFDDNIIDVLMMALNENNRGLYCFSCFHLERIHLGYLERISKRIPKDCDIFEQDILVFPANHNNHWGAVIAIKTIKEKKKIRWLIKWMDSLTGTISKDTIYRLCCYVKKYLICRKIHVYSDIEDINHIFHIPTDYTLKTNQQFPGTKDCGLYLYLFVVFLGHNIGNKETKKKIQSNLLKEIKIDEITQTYILKVRHHIVGIINDMIKKHEKKKLEKVEKEEEEEEIEKLLYCNKCKSHFKFNEVICECSNCEYKVHVECNDNSIGVFKCNKCKKDYKEIIFIQ